MYTFKTSVKLHDTDTAGFLFFAHQFKIAHDAYEDFMEAVGLGFGRIINASDFLIPIVRAEADYTAVLGVGDRLSIQLRAEKIGKTSFTLAYDLVGLDGKAVGRVKTVHVCVDNVKRKKISIPEKLRKALETIA